MASAVERQALLCDSRCCLALLIFMSCRIAYHQANGMLVSLGSSLFDLRFYSLNNDLFLAITCQQRVVDGHPAENARYMIIQKKRATLEDMRPFIDDSAQCKGHRHRPLLDLLLELSNNNTLSDEEIRDEVNTFIVAGYDTTSVTIAYVLMNLGTYPEVQDRVYDEVQSVVGDSDRDLEKADLPQLTYLEAVIKESLRLYPVAPALLRHADKDVQLKNYTIPAGAEVLLLMYGQNRHAIWGVDANEFRPERWLQPHPAHHSAFGSFSMDPAMMSMKTALVHVIRNYKITADIRELRLKLDFLAKPIAGSNIALKRRI